MSDTNEGYAKVTIYGLKDPSNGSIFYVGRSTRVRERFMQHLAEAERFSAEDKTILERLFGIKDESVTVKRIKEDEHTGNIRKLRWINQIKDRGDEVLLVILDEWEDCPCVEDANRLEDAWVAKMRGMNEPLTNYITSKRMQTWWYGTSNKNYREGYAKSPDEYIEMLKSGKVGSAKGQGGWRKKGRKNKPLNRAQKRRIAKKNYRKNVKGKK